MLHSRLNSLTVRLLFCCALAAISGCQSIIAPDSWSSALTSDSGDGPSIWSPSTWNPFGSSLDNDPESARSTALAAERLRHVLGKGTWDFDPLRLAARTTPATSLNGQFVGRLAVLDADTAIVRSALHAELENDDQAIATGAAILLAHRNDAAGRKLLIKAVEKQELPIAQRCAAAEALGALGHDQGLLKEQLLATRESARPPATSYDANWHAALVLGCSASLHPSKDAQMAALLYQAPIPSESASELEALPAECAWPQPQVRASSLLAWRGQNIPFPAEARVLRNDQLAEMRALYCRVAAVCDAASEFDTAVDELADNDLNVRFAAIELLGSMPSGSPLAEAAIQQLEELLAARGDLLQAAAVNSLGQLGAWKQVRAAANHKSWRVRQSVAEQFARVGAPRDTLPIVQQLLTDSNITVQEAAVNALRGMPLRDSGPLLMFAMENSSRIARTNAENILALKWPAARILRTTGEKTAERMQLLRQLGAQLAAQTANDVEQSAQDAIDATKSQAEAIATDAAQDLAEQAPLELRQAVAVLLSPDTPAIARDAAMTLLEDQGERVAHNLDQLLADAENQLGGQAADLETRLLPERFYLEVLPQYDPAFAALRKFAAEQDPQVRQLALSELIELTAEEELRPAALDRLAQLMQREQEVVLWRSAMRAIQTSPNAAAKRMARLAITNADPEVARRACEYFAAQGDAEAARMLTDSLDHPTSTVAIAAAVGLGHCESIPDIARFEQLLISPDRRLRVAAATSLARHNLQAGSDGLQRLVRDADPQIRRESATAMGDLRRIEFVPVLIDALDDSLSMRRAAQQSLERITRAYAIGPDLDDIDAANPALAWRRWYEAQATELAKLPASATEWSAVQAPSQPRGSVLVPVNEDAPAPPPFVSTTLEDRR